MIWSPLNKNTMHLFSGSLSFSLALYRCEIYKVRKRNPTKRNDEICKVRKENITKRNEIYKVRKQYQMKKRTNSDETKSTKTKRSETKSTKRKQNKRKSTKWKRNKTKQTKAIRNQRKQNEAISNEKKNEFCKVRQESKRNKSLFFVSTTRDIQ
jgi:hypothetical protein